MNDTIVSSKLISELKERNILIVENNQMKINPEYLIETSLGFENVAIKQNKNIVNSRLDIDISSEVIRGLKINIPLIASNMSTVTSPYFCKQLELAGGLGVLHRAYKSDFDYIFDVKEMRKQLRTVAVSVGVGQEQLALAKNLIKAGADVICIDIAHGYSDSVIEIARSIKQFNSNVKVIVGNTININSLYELNDVADAVKVGIAQGLACETKNTAGCTEKQFSAVLKFKSEAKRLGMPIISDGGIREPADLVKSIAAGASAVMAGSIFARCPESNAPVVEGKKLYAGMASRYVQDNWKGGLKDGTCPEGRVVMLEMGEPLAALMNRYSGALKSGITYSGSRNINEFQNKVEFVRV